jgi:lysophospholipase L1-like esterase
MRIPLTDRTRRLTAVLGATACLAATSSCTSTEGSDSEGATSAPASTSAADPGTYLALGDSVPFGFRGGEVGAYGDASNFVGYPELVGDELGLEVINAACPGETTASFLDPLAQSNGCENTAGSTFGYRSAYPLHTPYDSVNQSQLDLAVDRLNENDDVELVTVQIGANDAFLCQRTTASRCTDPADLQGVGQTVQSNLDRILSTLRDEGGYDGQIVVVTYYALNYADPTGAAIQQLDAGIAQAAQANGAQVADGYAAFEERANESGGDSVEAGLVLPSDVHPTEDGQQLLADAVTAVVD